MLLVRDSCPAEGAEDFADHMGVCLCVWMGFRGAGGCKDRLSPPQTARFSRRLPPALLKGPRPPSPKQEVFLESSGNRPDSPGGADSAAGMVLGPLIKAPGYKRSSVAIITFNERGDTGIFRRFFS